MNFAEYLEWRACGKSSVRINRREADMLGIAWPLKRTWAVNAKNRELPDDLVAALKAVFAVKFIAAARKQMPRAAQRALAASRQSA